MRNPSVEREGKARAAHGHSVDIPRHPPRDGARIVARRVASVLCLLEDALYRLIVVPLVAFSPAPLAYGVARWRGHWRYHIDTELRERIMRNLEDVLGEQLSPAARASVTHDFFRRRSCESVDVKRLAGKGRALLRLVEIHGLEHLEAAMAAGKGVMVCSAHFGQFNGAYSLLGVCGFPVTSVGNWPSTDDPGMSKARHIASRLLFEQFLARHRRRPSIEPGKAGPLGAIQIMEVLRANEVVCIPVDAPIMDPGDRTRAVQVDFLGRQARLLPGSAVVAQRAGAPVLVAVMRRSADCRHQVLDISPLVSAHGDDATVLFKRCVAAVEAPIRQHLAHWDFWEFRQCLINLGLVAGEPRKLPMSWDNHPDRLATASNGP
jgi:lauroyl/myristoyl acyltransferase